MLVPAGTEVTAVTAVTVVSVVTGVTAIKRRLAAVIILLSVYYHD